LFVTGAQTLDITVPVRKKREPGLHPHAIAELLDLRGKVALVTGGGVGIGKAATLRLAESGAAVMISDVNFPAAQALAQELTQKGHLADALQIDTSRVQDASRITQVTLDTFCDLDILVNNAGVFPLSPMLQTSEALWDQVMAVNLKSYFFTAQAAAQRMIATGKGGRIINIASIDAFRPASMLAHYDVSEAGIVLMTKSMALELAPYNIRVNAVAAGGIHSTAPDEKGQGKEERSDTIVRRIPLGRPGEPDDVARVVLFLASSFSDYITGETIVVDGGYLLS
jgi:2-dehydro-3-deoxy-D-gluconate 5-dehydrogenase